MRSQRRLYRAAETLTPYLGDIISYYRFNNDLNDQVGTNNGTGTAITYSDGKSGNASSFNGTSSNISLPSNILADLTEFSISLFVKLNTTSTEQRAISFNNSTNGAYISLRLNNGGVSNRIGFLVYNGVNGTPNIVDGFTLTDWTHLVITSKSFESNKLYVNGVLESTEIVNRGYSQVSSLGNNIGAARTGASSWCNGLIDGFSIYNKALDQYQVADIYNKQSAGNELL